MQYSGAGQQGPRKDADSCPKKKHDMTAMHFTIRHDEFNDRYSATGPIEPVWSVAQDEGEGEGKAKKSKEQLDAEKKAILKQRIKPLEIDGMGESQLAEKARELHTQILRLEGEKYDLEKRFKQLQVEVVSSHCCLSPWFLSSCSSLER